MPCECGHLKIEHQYERDGGQGSGKCTHGRTPNANIRKVCGCSTYRLTKGDNGKT